MAPPLRSVKAGLHPLHAAEILMTGNETCLPVVEEGILIGVVRLIDIFRALASSCSL
jgi:CBS domain-containing protein